MSRYQELFLSSCPLLLQGVLLTLQVLICAACISAFFGILGGVLLSNRLRLPIISPCIKAFAFVLRAVPFTVQLLLAYFVLPDMLSWDIDAFTASVLSLGLCSSGYVMHMVRGGINALCPLQWEAAFSLGYSTWESLRYIILPQVFRNIFPMWMNELESLLKSTAIVSSIGLLELTKMGMNLVSREMEPIPIYLMVAIFYIALSFIMHLIAQVCEKKVCYARS